MALTSLKIKTFCLVGAVSYTYRGIQTHFTING